MSFLTAASLSLILISLVIVFGFAQSNLTSDTWKSTAPMPTARAQLGVAVVNGKIYAIGGSANDPEVGPIVLNFTEEYDPLTDTWATKAPMPTARHSFGIAVFENKIYCIGGSINGPHLTLNQVYDPATDTWETKMPMPTPRAGLSANTVNGKVYLMGGDSANTTNEAYDPVTDSWFTKTQVPGGIIYSPSAVVDNKIYLFGSLSNPSLNQIYDPETDTWASGANVPEGVADGAAAATSGANAPVEIYVMGGLTTYLVNGNTFANYSNLNQVYDPKSNTWSTGAPLPTRLRFFGLANSNDTFYAIGGFPGMIGFLNTNYQYTPIDYGNPGQEPTLPFQDYTVLALAAAAIVIVSAAVMTRLKRSHLPLAGGIMAVLVSLIVLALTIIDVQGIFSYFAYRHDQILSTDTIFYFYLAVAILGVFAVAFGLAAGLFALQKKRLRLTLFGLSLLTVYGAIISIYFFIFGLPVLAFSIIANVFVSLSKAEFDNNL
jgi:N-acetylneuraminic acid mutarotase